MSKIEKKSKRTKSLEKLLVPGKKVRVDYGPTNINNELLHVRAIVDDAVVVTKFWVKHKKYWRYKCDSFNYYRLLYERGYLKPA